MTNTELKTQIDTALNNSVPNESITPVSVAAQIKSVVDYVDQEINSIPSGVNPYKNYVAYIQFSSDGSPLDTEIFNDLESGISFTLNSTGIYEMAVFTTSFTTKTVITPFDRISGNPAGVRLPIFNNSTGLVVGYYTINRWNSSSVRIHFWNTTNTLVNPFTLLDTRAISVDIKVYN